MTPDADHSPRTADAYCHSAAEARWLEAVRDAARAGVGYGWMQQVIEVEWNATGQTPGSAWGPAYFEQEMARLEAEIHRLTAAHGRRDDDEE